MRVTLREIAARTCKRRDSWWTVLLVDPIAVRIVWLVQPYRYLTPAVFTALAFVFAVAAAAAFMKGTPGVVSIGAVLFYISFLFDCVDGKVARLRGGSFVGIWLDFIVDRARFLLAAGALFIGQYRVSDDPTFLAIGAAVVIFDLFHYVNGAEVMQIRDSMHRALGSAPRDTPQSMTTLARPTPTMRAFEAAAAWLRRFRIRPRLFSGIEFEQAIGVVAPLSGSILLVSDAALALGVVSEVAVIVLLVRSARATTRTLQHAGPANAVLITQPVDRVGGPAEQTGWQSTDDGGTHDGGTYPDGQPGLRLQQEA